jgi:hypothetical protein
MRLILQDLDSRKLFEGELRKAVESAEDEPVNEPTSTLDNRHLESHGSASALSRERARRADQIGLRL